MEGRADLCLALFFIGWVSMDEGVAVVVPSVGQPYWSWVASMFASDKPDRMMLKPVLDKPVDIARNIGGRYLLGFEPGSIDYLLFTDRDATWHPGAITRLLERKLDIVTGVIYRRQTPPMPTMGLYKGKNNKGHHHYDMAGPAVKVLERAEREGLDFQTSNEILFDKADDDLLKIDGVGMHFCLIHRRVFETVPEPWFENTTKTGGEDFYFCRKARSWGFEIYADLSVHTGHVAARDVIFGLRDWMVYKTMAGSMDKLIEWLGPTRYKEE